MKLNIVPARTGIEWVRLGIRTFMKQPLALVALTFMYLAVGAILVATQTAVGSLLAIAIVPAATLGFMAATKDASEGRFPTLKVFLSAFRAGRERVRAMLVLGLLYTAACVVVALLTQWAVDVPALPASYDPRTPPPPEFVAAFMERSLLGFALYVPVSILFWHAPALVHWHGVSPVKSLFFSAVAYVRNIRAMVAYNLGWLAFGFGIVVVMWIVALLTGRAELSAGVAISLVPIASTVFFSSVYFTFRDSFVEDSGETHDPAPPARP